MNYYKRWLQKHSLNYLFYVFMMIVIGILISLSVWSYHAHDPSWFFISTHPVKIRNMLGAFGAQCAALLLFLFGSAALLIGPCLIMNAYLVLKSSFQQEWDRGVACIGFMLSFAALEHAYKITVFRHAFVAGGAFGLMLYRVVHILFDPLLIGIFLYVMMMISLLIIFRFALASLVCTWWYHVGFSRFFSAVLRSLMQRCTFSSTSERDSEYNDVDYNDHFWSTYGSSSIDQQPNQAQEQPEEKTISTSDAQVYRLPPRDMLQYREQKTSDTDREYELLARVLEEKLARFGIEGNVVSIRRGPVITLFEYQPHIDSKISKIIALEDDLALALQALSIRIIAPIPGKSVVGFEVANKEREHVLLSAIVHSAEFSAFSGLLPLIIGVDTIGKPVIADLVAMPHMLIAGATGSGKSVALNVMLLSLLYRCTPDDLALILIDPKRLEFAPYADIPHLIFPIVTNSRDVAPILQWLLDTMEERYEKMAALGVRNIIDYNKICVQNNQARFTFIVVMIDELSDVMIVAGKDIEERIARIAQMARAAGIHLVVATQRPSVDVITGIIKANFPSRISFKVATKIDSRTILDAIGADKLLGKGDMLYLDTSSRIWRMHGAYVSDKEIEQITSWIRSMRAVQYQELPQEISCPDADLAEIDKELYQHVLDYIQSTDEISISLLQRKFRIGYNRSARIIDKLQTEGLIMPSQGGKMRKVIRS